MMIAVWTKGGYITAPIEMKHMALLKTEGTIGGTGKDI